MLYVISTPIGNIEDISLRALKTLKETELILAEDTRRTGILLNHYEIKNKMLSFNEHNQERRTKEVLELIKEKNVALVSDSGTPGISDPGFYLIRECVRQGIKVSAIPGANAAITALVCSALPTNKFCFLGFLSKKEKKKKELFENITMTTIAYESPHRIQKTLQQMKETIPNHQIAVCREMTKKFEEFVRGTTTEVYEKLKNKNIKGEIVLVITPPTKLKN